MSKSLPESALKRLETEKNIWVATIRPQKGRDFPVRPHLVPVWFAWHSEKLYICIQAQSVKGQNLRQNPLVSLSLEDGSKVVICEGRTAQINKPGPAAIQAIFKEKYDWDLDSDDEYDMLLEITPRKWLVW
jgi:hypothetical protein